MQEETKLEGFKCASYGATTSSGAHTASGLSSCPAGFCSDIGDEGRAFCLIGRHRLVTTCIIVTRQQG